MSATSKIVGFSIGCSAALAVMAIAIGPQKTVDFSATALGAFGTGAGAFVGGFDEFGNNLSKAIDMSDTSTDKPPAKAKANG